MGALGRRLDFVAPARRVGGKLGVKRAGAGDADAQGEQAALGAIGLGAGGRLDCAQQAGGIVMGGGVEHDVGEPRAIDDEAAQPGDLAILDIDQNRALGAGFADVAALQIAGKDDPGVLRDHFMGVDMAERPVGIIFRAQIIERCRARRTHGRGGRRASCAARRY